MTADDIDRLLKEVYERGGNPEFTIHKHPKTGQTVEINWTALTEEERISLAKLLRSEGYIT